MLLPVFLRPDDPTVDADDGIVQVDTGFTEEMGFQAEPDIDDGIDKTDRIKEDVFLFRQPDAGDPGEDGQVFERGGMNDAFKELFQKTFHRCKNPQIILLCLKEIGHEQYSRGAGADHGRGFGHWTSDGRRMSASGCPAGNHLG